MSKYRVIVCSLLLCAGVWAETLNVSAAVAKALETYPGVRAAQYKLKAAEQQESYAYSYLWPNLALKGSYANSQDSDYYNLSGSKASTYETTNPAMKDVIHTTQTGLSATMPLFNAGVFQGAALAQVNKKMAQVDLDKARADTVYTVKQVYYQLLLARKTLAVLEKRVAQSAEDLTAISARYSSGLVQKTDVLRAEIQLRNNRQDVLNAQKNLVLAEQNFAAYIPELEVQTVALEMEAFPEEKDLPAFESCVETMYAQRPEWRSYQYAKQITMENYKLAQSDLYPTLTLVGSKTWDKLSMPDLAYGQDNTVMMIQGSWTLFNGFGTWQNMDAKWQQYKGAEATEQALTRNYEVELRDAYLTAKNSYMQLTNSRATLQLSRENYNQVKARYTGGMDTNLTFIDASTTLLNAEVGVINAEVNVVLAVARLQKTMGVLR